MRAFCTIVTANYLYYALALYRSYRQFADVPMHVLCIDQPTDVTDSEISVFYADRVFTEGVGRAMLEKHRATPDHLRWSLKAVWMDHLLSSGGFDEVLFVDPDLYFYADPTFLFELLAGSSILLSPHWRSSDPLRDWRNFERNFSDGIYNGGFIGATKQGRPALQWLASSCLYKCEVNRAQGLFVDQKYLDLLHSRFPNVLSLSHKGCNVANWNRVDCKRTVLDGQVLINGTEPVVFIHFTKSTIRGIRSGRDGLLLPFLEEYERALCSINGSHAVSVNPGERKPLFQGIIGKMLSRR